VALSEVLAFLSLLGYAALLGQAIWKTWLMGQDDWGLYNHGLDKMPEVIKWALRYCLNQGFIVIQDRNSEHFVQFRKYILRNGGYGLELGFPEAPWSRTYFPKLRDALTAEGTPFRETRESQGEVTAFIHVDCGQDIDRAVELARLCIFDIFGLGADCRFKSSPSNYSVLYDVVDDPDYANPAASQWWSTWRAREQAKGRPDPALVFKAAAFTFGFVFCCYPALWLAWFLADPSYPDWRWSVGSVHLAGSHPTLILLPIFCVLLAGFTMAGRELSRGPKLRPRTRIDQIAGLLATFGLPIAVVASWLGT